MKTFIDSNVFIYSFLNQGVGKKQVAARLLAQAIRDGNGYISLQVVKIVTGGERVLQRADEEVQQASVGNPLRIGYLQPVQS